MAASDKSAFLISDEASADLLKQIRAQVTRMMRQHPTAQSHTSIVGNVLVKVLRSGKLADAPNQYYLIGAIRTAIHEVMVDGLRRRYRRKRSNQNGLPDDQTRQRFSESIDDDSQQFIELNEALSELERIAPRPAAVVTLRYFAGLTVAEVARELGVSVSTVEADWRSARAWLFQKLRDD